MYQFPIHLDSSTDMQKYIHIIETIPFSGKICGHTFQCTAQDILEIFFRYQRQPLILTVSEDQQKEAEEIQNYLTREELIKAYPFSE